MASEKKEQVYGVYVDQQAWLEKMARLYDLPDVAKALRILIDFAIEEGDEQAIFASQNSRCRHCG